jgi:hypothetical protein
MTAVPHPLYLSDIAPQGFSLFQILKLVLKGKRFNVTITIKENPHVTHMEFNRGLPQVLQTIAEYGHNGPRHTLQGPEWNGHKMYTKKFSPENL